MFDRDSEETFLDFPITPGMKDISLKKDELMQMFNQNNTWIDLNSVLL